jgi:RNA polymerase sigma-70 factor (ECF subfamily)
MTSKTIEFDELYQQTYKLMFRTVCMKYAKGDYDLASEFCQLGYIRVHANLHTFRNEGSIEGWVRRVMITTILTQLVKRKKSLETVSAFNFEENNIGDEPVERVEDTTFMGKYSAKDINNAIVSLADGYKFTFYQYFYENRSHREIATSLGINEGTSRSQLAKAKAKVRQYLENLKR